MRQTRDLSYPGSHLRLWASAVWVGSISALWHPSKLSVLSNPWRAFHPSVCSATFWTHVKKIVISTWSHCPRSKAVVHGGCRIPHFISYSQATCWFIWHLPSSWTRGVSLLLYSFFPVQSWFYTPLSHPPSVYLPCKQKSPSLLNPSPHGSCFIPLILPVTLLCTNSAASVGQGRDGNQHNEESLHIYRAARWYLSQQRLKVCFSAMTTLWAHSFLEYPFQLP